MNSSQNFRVLVAFAMLLIFNAIAFTGGGQNSSSLTINGFTVNFSGGDGLTDNTAFQISTADQLRAFSEYVNRGGSTITPQGKTYFFALTSDIDLNNEEFTPIGYYIDTMEHHTIFRGRFNGNGHIIKNLKIRHNYYGQHLNPPQHLASDLALFGAMSYINPNVTDGNYQHNDICAIENVGVENVDIYGDHTGYGRAAIVAAAGSFEYIRNCFVRNGSIGELHTTAGILGGTYYKYFVTKSIDIDGTTTQIPQIYNCYVDNVTIQGAGAGAIVSDNSMLANSVHDCWSTATIIGQERHNGELVNSTNPDVADAQTCFVVGGNFSGERGNYDAGITDRFTIDNGDTTWYQRGLVFNNSDDLRDAVLALPNCPFIGVEQNDTTILRLKTEYFGGKSYLDLAIGKWNLIGSFGALSQLNNNSKGCDMAVVAFDYNGTNDWNTEHYLALSDNDEIISGHSYFVWAFANQPLQGDQTEGTTIDATSTQLTAIPSATGDQTITLNNTTSQQVKYFLFSNPQNKDINVTPLQGTQVPVYNPNATNSAWEQVSTINPCQGFYIQSENSSLTANFTIGNVSFTAGNAKQVNEQDQEINFDLLQQINNNRIMFLAKANNTICQTLAKQYERSSNGFDRFDTYIMFDEDNEDLVQPYFVVDNQKNVYSNIFNQLPYICPINFLSQKEQPVELQVNNIPSNLSVSIIDLASGEEFVFDGENSFNFLAQEGKNNNRYSIKFSAKNVSLQSAENDNNITIFNNNQTLNIQGNNLKNVTIVNLLGQVVTNKAISGNNITMDMELNTGAYIVKVNSDKGEKVQKIIIK